MKKFIVFILLVKFLMANVFVIADRNLTNSDKSFLRDTVFLENRYIYTQKIADGSIFFLKLKRGQTLKYLEKYRPKKYSIYKIINNLMENNDLKQGDTVIIFSNMYFTINIPNKVYINTKTQILNDGFITSEYSPFYILLHKNINKLKGVNIMIITDNNQPIYYLQKMRRFYYYLFQKLGANLYFYGNDIYKCKDHCDTNRLALMYYGSLKKRTNLFKFSPLESTNSLQVINIKDRSINNIGVNLRIRDDIFYNGFNK